MKEKREPSIQDLQTAEDLCALNKVYELMRIEYGVIDYKSVMIVYDILKRIGQGEKLLEVY